MTVEEQELKPCFRIYVPSKTKAGGPIPIDKLTNFCVIIVRRFILKNRGCYMPPMGTGFYLSDAGEALVEPICIIESVGVFPFSEEELTLWAINLDQESIRVEEGGLVIAHHYTGEIKHINFEIKINAGIGYCIELNPEQFRHQGVYGETEVLDIPEKYVISCISYDEIGQPMSPELLSENAISQIMSESDTHTNLLLQALLKELDILNSK